MLRDQHAELQLLHAGTASTPGTVRTPGANTERQSTLPLGLTLGRAQETSLHSADLLRRLELQQRTLAEDMSRLSKDAASLQHMSAPR